MPAIPLIAAVAPLVISSVMNAGDKGKGQSNFKATPYTPAGVNQTGPHTTIPGALGGAKPPMPGPMRTPPMPIPGGALRPMNGAPAPSAGVPTAPMQMGQRPVGPPPMPGPPPVMAPGAPRRF